MSDAHEHTAPAAGVPWRLDHARRSDRRVLARSSLTIAGRVVSKLAIVAFLVLAARLLSKQEYGVYSYLLVLAATFGVLADPQVTVVAGRDVSTGLHGAGTSYRAALPIVLVAGALGGAALLAFGTIDAGPGATPHALLIAGLYVVFNRLSSLGLDMLRALGRFGTEAAIETGGTVALVVVAGAVAAAGLGVTAVLGVFLAHALLSTLVCHVVLAPELGPYSAPRRYRRELVRSGIRLGLAAAATAVATRGPLIVLGLTGSAVAVASLSAAMRLPDAAYLVALTAGQAMLPSIAAILTVDPGRARRLARRAIGLSALAGALLALAVVPFAAQITATVFGEQYASSGTPMAILMSAVPFMGMFWISFFALCAYRHERSVLAVTAGCSSAALLAASLVIPGAGVEQAAWVQAAGLVVLALATYAAFELRAAATIRSAAAAAVAS